MNLPIQTAHRRATSEQSSTALASEFKRLDDEFRLLNGRLREIGPLLADARHELVERSYEVACPRERCTAPAGQPCLNLNAGGPKKWPHDQRINAYFDALGITDHPDLSWPA